jgi:YjbE family integral membrane protein
LDLGTVKYDRIAAGIVSVQFAVYGQTTQLHQKRIEDEMTLTAADFLAIAEIIWINVLLSGDNAVVIALACRSLPDRQRRIGISLGAAAAVGLRIIFAYLVAQLLEIPFLQVTGGVLLLWIAIKLLNDNSQPDESDVKASTKLWSAVGTIAMADMVMSLDNVVAITAIAGENYHLFIFGLALSIPLVVVGASLITNLIAKFPILVWAGAALLGWIGGRMIIDDDQAWLTLGFTFAPVLHVAAAALGAMLVLALGYIVKRRADGLKT